MLVDANAFFFYLCCGAVCLWIYNTLDNVDGKLARQVCCRCGLLLSAAERLASARFPRCPARLHQD